VARTEVPAALSERREAARTPALRAGRRGDRLIAVLQEAQDSQIQRLSHPDGDRLADLPLNQASRLV